MPTQHKREAVQLRPEVHSLILQLATETSLSKSKVLSLLVEEALKARGMYDGPALSANAKMLPPDVLESVRTEAGEQLPVTRNTHAKPDGLSFTQRINQNIAESKIKEPSTDTDVLNNLGSDDEEMLRKIKVLQAAGIL